MKLFVIYIGGSHESALLELHDMRFVIANTIEETYESLRKTWWGSPQSLHLDAWGELHYADGHHIQIAKHPPAVQDKTLFFVNLGGYDAKQFTELHHNVFVVAKDATEAKKKAVQQITHWTSPHRDYLHEVDTILSLNELLQKQDYHIHLQASDEAEPFNFTCYYVPIGMKN